MKKIIGYILAIVMVVSIASTTMGNAKMGGGGFPLEYNADKEIIANGNGNGSQIDEKSGVDVGKTGGSSENLSQNGNGNNLVSMDEKTDTKAGNVEKTGGIAPLGGTAGSKTVTPKNLALNEDGNIEDAGGFIYARGNKIRIEAGTKEEYTKIFVGDSKTPYDFGRMKGGSVDTGFDLRYTTICGGYRTTLNYDTEITMIGGNVRTIYGGNNNKALNGSTFVTIEGGTIGEVCGSGRNAKAQNTTINITGGKITTVYGCAEGGSAENSQINVSGDANIGTVYGGGLQQNGTSANATVTIAGGTIGNIFGGGHDAKVTIANVIISDGTINGNVYGGGTVAGYDADVTTSNITIKGGTINGNVYCCGKGTPVATATCNISGGTIKGNFYGGGENGGTVTTPTLNISGNPKIGRDDIDNNADRGIIINGGTPAVTDNVEFFNIVGALKEGAEINVVLPSGYTTPKTIAVGDNLVTPGIDKYEIKDSDFPKVLPIGSFDRSQTKARRVAADNKIEVVTATIKVIYNENNTTFKGKAPVDLTYANDGDTATVLGNVGIKGDGTDKLKCNGFVFVEWNTAADGSGTPYKEGDTFPITGDMDLYAVWEKKSAPSGGGSGSSDTRYYGVSDTTGNGITPKNEDGKYTYAVDGGNFVLDNIGGMQGGKTYSITVNPNEGYVLDYIMINGEKTTDLTFTMPMKNVDIQVVFKNNTTVVPTPTPSDKPTPGVETAFPWWIVILVGAIVLFIIIIIITKKKKDNEEKHNGGNGNGNGNDANQNGNDNELK